MNPICKTGVCIVSEHKHGESVNAHLSAPVNRQPETHRPVLHTYTVWIILVFSSERERDKACTLRESHIYYNWKKWGRTKRGCSCSTVLEESVFIPCLTGLTFHIRISAYRQSHLKGLCINQLEFKI